MALIDTNIARPTIVLHNGDTIDLQELAVVIQKLIGDGSPLFINKGDLAVGQGLFNFASRFPVGGDGLFLKADSAQSLGLIWSAPSGAGDVVGPASAVDLHIVLFDATSGKLIQDSGKTIAEIFADHVALADPHSQYALDTDLSSYQLLDALLTSISSLSFATNGLKVLRVNSGETDFEFASVGGDVVGPTVAVDNQIAVYDGTTGKLIKDGGQVISALQLQDALLDSIATLVFSSNSLKVLRVNVGETAFEFLALGTLATQNGTFSGTSSGVNTGDQDLSSLVVGPASVTLDRIVLFNGTTGKLIKESTKLISDLQLQDPLLDSLALLVFASNALKHLRVNTGETAFEFVDPPAGGGDVVGPVSSTNNYITLFADATGKVIKDSGILISAKQDQDALLDSIATLVFAANALKHLRVNAAETAFELVTAAGGGDVNGPASSVNNRVVFFDGVTGKLIKDSGLLLSGSNTGDQTITLTGDVTGSGVGSFPATIGNDKVTTLKILDAAVTLAKMSDIATKTYIGRTAAGSGVPSAVPIATLKSDLGLVKADVGLGSVDNTADSAKSVLNATEWDGAVKTSSTSAPSGGADGDIHFKYTA